MRHGERVKKAPLPFTTSTLQQEASKVLNFSTQKTMRLAQQLYEGVDIKGEGTVGLITYLRTDSTRVSEEAETQAAEFIDVHYGEKYKTAAATEKKNSQKIQDAHEAEPDAYCYQGAASQRSVPSVSADLETICGKPHECCTV